jgi:hypothetical protein
MKKRDETLRLKRWGGEERKKNHVATENSTQKWEWSTLKEKSQAHTQ